MNKYLLLSVTLLGVSSFSFAQEENTKKEETQLISVESEQEFETPKYNKWSLEVDFGESKGLKPYNRTGLFYGGDPDKVLGGFQFNHYGIAGRWMFSPKFGLKSHFSFSDIKNLNGSESRPFQMHYLQFTAEGVINGARLFEIEQSMKKFGFLFHFGFQVSEMTPKSNPFTKGREEYNGGFVIGITPQYVIFKNISAFIDFQLDANFRQHFNWDGSRADRTENLTGTMFTSALGLSYSFGKGGVHGDWAIIESDKSKEIEELNSRIGEIEAMLNDTDKDGVPDYLDQEGNTLSGTDVDTKGRAVDMNSNGVPDQLEKYVDKSVVTTTSTNNAAIADDVLEKLIDQGYIAAYFDTGKSEPTLASADNIGFILNYLKNNPKKSVEIIGYADETGSVELNNQLTQDRANNVKTILVKAGISESRLTIIGNGIDNSVDKNSTYTRRLVRKVIFKVK